MDQTFWEQMASLENRMEAMFRNFGVWTPGRTGMLQARPYAPAMDVIARNGDVLYRFDVPGIDPAKDLTITVEGDELTIHGERHEATEVAEDRYYRVETFKGAFERHIPLPAGTVPDKITAEYANGVLQVVVPNAAKPADAKPRKIAVKAAAPART